MPLDDNDDPHAAPQHDEDGAPGAEEDDMPDYKLFMSMFEKRGVSSKTIRKGEKDFEEHGTRAQENTLETSRRALEDVLGYTRVHKMDSWTRGWLLPNFWEDASYNRPSSSANLDSSNNINTRNDDNNNDDGSSDSKKNRNSGNSSSSSSSRNIDGDADDDLRLADRVVCVEHEKGGWMRDIGRVISGKKDRLGVGRLWLLPEEALYLVERGTLDLWWPSLDFEELIPRAGGGAREGFGPDDYEPGIPLSLEAAYSLLIGFEGERGKTTLPKYQVYTHLKRAGFNVLRAPPSLPPPPPPPPASQSIWEWLFSYLAPAREQKPFGPLVAPGLYRSYGPVYAQLALLPRHKPVAAGDSEALAPQEPFKVHYHVWKPAGGFSKRSPPREDFRIAVADAGETCVPTLEQMTALVGAAPSEPAPEAWRGQPGKLYQRLKHGHRNVLIAVVDRGLVNYMRFGEGAFGEEKLYERFGAARGGKKGGGRGGRGERRGNRR